MSKTDWLKNTGDWLKQNWVALVIGAALAIASVLAMTHFVKYASERSATELADARHFRFSRDSTHALPHPAGTPEEVMVRLDAQLLDVRSQAHYHLGATRSFFSYQFAHVTVASIAAILAGILLVPITKQGWNDAPRVLTAPFLVSAGIAVLFGGLNQVYRHDQNIAENTTLYFAYLSLEDELLSYYPRIIEGDTTVAPAAQLIVEVDGRLQSLRRFGVGLDASQVPDFGSVATQMGAGQEPGAP